MSREEVESVLASGGELSVSEILRSRVRYLSESAAIGGAEFVERVYEENRQRFTARRSEAGRVMRGSDWGGLRVLRGLRRKLSG